MYARLVTGSIPPEKLDAAIQLWREVVLPSVQERAGFKGVRLLADRETGRIASMGLWESRADYEATIGWNEEQIEKFAAFFSTPPAVAGYDVVADV